MDRFSGGTSENHRGERMEKIVKSGKKLRLTLDCSAIIIRICLKYKIINLLNVIIFIDYSTISFYLIEVSWGIKWHKWNVQYLLIFLTVLYVKKS